MTKIEETLNADAKAWCENLNLSIAWGVVLDPVRILKQTTRPDGSIQVRAVMHVEFWEYPQSGSGWHRYYYRAVDVTFLHDAETAETVLGEDLIHNTEAQNDSFDERAALAAFTKRFE